MKNTRKILAMAIVLVTLLLTMSTLVSFADEGGMTVYLSPNSNWKADNARFAIYVWDSNNVYQWVDMTDADGDGVYEATVPAGYNNIIFCRMDPSHTSNKWDYMWNQTEDLTIPTNGDNLYKIASGTWDKGGGEWSHYDNTMCIHSPKDSGSVISPADCANEGSIAHTCSKCGESYTETIKKTKHSYDVNCKCTVCGYEAIYIVAGNVMKNGDVYASGDNSTLFVSKWDVTDESNRMTYDADADCFVKIYKNVAAGEYHFKIAENMSWDVSYGSDGGNCYLKVEEDGSTVSIILKDGSVSAASAKPALPDKPNTPAEPDNEPEQDDVDNQPENEPELNFFQKIFKAIGDFFKGIGDFFKNLFA